MSSITVDTCINLWCKQQHIVFVKLQGLWGVDLKRCVTLFGSSGGHVEREREIMNTWVLQVVREMKEKEREGSGRKEIGAKLLI